MEDMYIELFEKLSRLHMLLQRHHMMNHAEHGPFADATRGQGRVLAALKIQPEISTKDLSYLLGIRVPSLNELLNKLEKSGHIVRKPSEVDKRVMIIHLTEKGKATPQADTDYSSIFDCLSEEEQETFGEYLDRVIKALEAQIGDAPDEDEMANWMRAARMRMGNERFEQLTAMRESGFRFGARPHGQHGADHFGAHCHGHAPEGHGRGHGHDHAGFGFGFDHGHKGKKGTSPKESNEPEDK